LINNMPHWFYNQRMFQLPHQTRSKDIRNVAYQ
jgi:hypothetical protein